MDPITSAVLGVLMRWMHILSMATLLGGTIYSRFVLLPASEILNEEQRNRVAAETARRFRQWVLLAVIGLFISGTYNLAVKTNIPPNYPAVFAFKMLLALHVIVVSILLNRASINEGRRNRLLAGVVVSGVTIVLLSAYLRYISNWMVS